jgi:hypothetical protein
VVKGRRFDAAVFADTQEEPAAVYSHLDWLRSLSGPPIFTATAGRLGSDLINGRNSTGGRFAAIPVFTSPVDPGGSPGRARRQCSKEYKTEVIERSIRRDLLGLRPRQRVPRSIRLVQYFGISWDERSRASRIWERFHIEHSTQASPVFPLVDRQWTRANCLEWLSARVPHQVPRSACVFCPFRSDSSWQALKDGGGADWDRAIEIDRSLRSPGTVAARDMMQPMFLHRSCVPLVQVDFRPRVSSKETQLGFGFDVECDGVCGV